MAVRKLRDRLQETPRGRALIRVFTSTGEGMMLGGLIAFFGTFVLLFVLLVALWFFVADEYTINRLSLVSGAFSGLALLWISVVVLRIEAKRDRAQYVVDEIRVHESPQPHNPDEFKLACRIINTGGTPSVIWGGQSWVRAFDKYGSRLRLNATFWPPVAFHSNFKPDWSDVAPGDQVIEPGRMRDFIVIVELPHAIDAAGTKLELVVTPAIGPRTAMQVEVKELQDWLAKVRERHPRPPAQ